MTWLTPTNIISVALTFVTLCYTIITWMMLHESRLIRKQKTAPNVIGYLQTMSNRDILCLYIKNVGEGYARNVKVQLIRDYFIFNNKESLKDFPLFNDGVTIYPSGYDLHFLLDSWSNLKQNHHQENYIEFNIYYENMKGKPNCVHFKLPLKQIATMTSTPPEDSIDQISYYLSEVNKTLKDFNKKS